MAETLFLVNGDVCLGLWELSGSHAIAIVGLGLPIQGMGFAVQTYTYPDSATRTRGKRLVWKEIQMSKQHNPVSKAALVSALAMVLAATPVAMPPMTSEAWWMRTWALLVATTTAVAYQTGRKRGVLCDSSAAATKADEAWPEGTLELRGLRIL